MKIAVIHPNFNTKGGAENVVYWLCEDLATAYGLKLTVFSLDFGKYEDRFKAIKGLGIDKIPVPGLFRRFNIFALLFAAVYLRNKLKDYGVVNPHNYPASLWVGLANILSGNRLPRIIWSCNEPAKFLYKTICYKNTPKNLQVAFSDVNTDLRIKTSSRIKFALKNLYRPILRCLDRQGVRTFDKILSISKTCNQQVREIYHVDNVFTCDLGIKGFTTTNSSEVGGEGDYFLTVSRLEGYKNIPKAIEAFALLKRRKKLAGVRYYIIGTGPMEPYLRKTIEKNHLSQDVRLLGFVTKEQLMDYYQSCMFIVYLPYDEPFGLAYLEAAAFSKPAIASDHAGPAEIVIDGKTGLLTDPADVEKIANSIECMCAFADARKKMGENAFIRLKQKFLWEGYVERFVGHLTM